MSLVASSDLDIQVIDQFVKDSGYTTEFDGDNSIYVSGSQLDFPCWIDLLSDLYAIKIVTFIDFKKDVTETEALNFVNNASMNIAFPSFYIANDNPGEALRMYSSYFIDVENGLESGYLMKSMVRFIGAFGASLTLDDEDHFFE